MKLEIGQLPGAWCAGLVPMWWVAWFAVYVLVCDVVSASSHCALFALYFSRLNRLPVVGVVLVVARVRAGVALPTVTMLPSGSA